MSDLHDKLDKVRDRESFFDFVQALIEDRIDKAKDENRYPYGGQPGGWESSTIESYLEAALRWAQDSRDLPIGISSEASWRGFATFLLLRQDVRVTNRSLRQSQWRRRTRARESCASKIVPRLAALRNSRPGIGRRDRSHASYQSRPNRVHRGNPAPMKIATARSLAPSKSIPRAS